MLCVMNCKKINKCIGNQQRNRHLYFPGQHYSFQGFFQNFPYLWSFSRLFKALKISTLNSRTFHTFPESVRTLNVKQSAEYHTLGNISCSSFTTPHSSWPRSTVSTVWSSFVAVTCKTSCEMSLCWNLVRLPRIPETSENFCSATLNTVMNNNSNWYLLCRYRHGQRISSDTSDQIR